MSAIECSQNDVVGFGMLEFDEGIDSCMSP